MSGMQSLRLTLDHHAPADGLRAKPPHTPFPVQQHQPVTQEIAVTPGAGNALLLQNDHSDCPSFLVREHPLGCRLAG